MASSQPTQAAIRGLPDDGVLISLTFSNITVKSVRIVRSDNEPDIAVSPEPGGSVIYATAGIVLADIDSIHVTAETGGPLEGAVVLDVLHLERRIKSAAIPIMLPAAPGERKILEFETDRIDRRQELIAHLTANRNYYSNVIHRNLDSGTVIAMLAEYEWNGKPLIDQVEPRPLAVAGNYLVFLAPVDPAEGSGVHADGVQKTWNEVLEDRAIKPGQQAADTRLIPLPTSGVFAEAVLGRSNSAEKLDITRFWNWQDSPLPLTPPDIAPVGTGSRGVAEDLKPGQLSPPVLNITNPTSLPDPTGVGAILGALATSNMFRDMSGLAGTQGLAQAAMQETTDAATDAGQIASANMRTQAQKSVAMAQVAADIIKSIYGGGGGSSSGAAGISGSGAVINHGRSMDQRTNGSTTNGQGPGNLGSLKTPGTGGQSPSPQSPTTVAGGGSSYEGAAFGQTVHGPLGTSGMNAAQSATNVASNDSELQLTQVSDKPKPPETIFAGQAITRLQQLGRIGEVMMARHLTQEGFVVFWDPYKSIAGNGPDMVALDIRPGSKTSGQVWIIDNKSQFKGIANAPALSSAEADEFVHKLLSSLDRSPQKEHAAQALRELNNPGQPKVRRVVSNAFAGEKTRFTKSFFERVPFTMSEHPKFAAYDFRFAELFESHKPWADRYNAAKSGLTGGRRVTGLHGVKGAVAADGVIAVIFAIGEAYYAIKEGQDVGTVVAQKVEEVTVAVAESAVVSAVLLAFPALNPVVLAASVIGVFDSKLPDRKPEDEVAAKIEQYVADLFPGYKTLPKVDQDRLKKCVIEAFEDPLQPEIAPSLVPVPPTPTATQTSPAGAGYI